MSKSLLYIIVLIIAGLFVLWLVIARPIVTIKSAIKSEDQPNSIRLQRHVEVISKVFVPRDGEHPEILGKVADYLSSEFRSTGGRVNYQEFAVDNIRYQNVIVEYGPENASNILVIGAHYDTAGDHPGADDNASGVAGLLELGRLLSRAKLQSKVILVAYVLEEPPYYRTAQMGSAVHAKSLKERGISVKLMISLEMIGYFSDRENSQGFPLPLLKLFYPTRGNFILVVDRLFSNQAQGLKRAMSAASELPVYSINAPAVVPGVDFSDHLNFWNQGYPAVMVTDTAFYRYDGYHTRKDTADRLDYLRMAQVVAGLYNYVIETNEIK